MTQTRPSPAATPPHAPDVPRMTRPAARRRRTWPAAGRRGPALYATPNWLQAALIVALLGAAVYVAIDEHYLWGALLAVAGVAFGVSLCCGGWWGMSMVDRKRIIVGITGASGAVYARRILEAAVLRDGSAAGTRA